MGGKASYNTVITIKKYSNRRLYDMTHSRYLTIEELGELIQQGFDVQVIDSKTKEDITQAILTQIVMERDGIYLFSTSFLHQIIRNREGILGEFFTDFVPKMLDSYLDTRDAMQRQFLSFTHPWLMGSEMKIPFFNPFNDSKSKASSRNRSLKLPKNKEQERQRIPVSYTHLTLPTKRIV